MATGASSREVAAQLFLNPHTIEAHLCSIFGKLGITLRRQLKELRLPERRAVVKDPDVRIDVSIP